MPRSKRFETLASRPVNQDGFVEEWPEVGLIAVGSPNDPKPSTRIENGRVVDLDGKLRAEFDLNDQFIADHAIDLEKVPRAMGMDSVEIARMLVDINVPRDEVTAITGGLTPAKIVEVVDKLNVVEMMMAMQKMRSRKTPSNQCHVTNLRDNPVLMAADSAEAAVRGFDEHETTVGVVRYAPFNALALLIGSQTGRGGVLTQCALEEATELMLAMRGITSYAETISVYGTEQVFVDGDDTPWSKALLASAYASRGSKMRFTSGTGSEVRLCRCDVQAMERYLHALCTLDLLIYDEGDNLFHNTNISSQYLVEGLKNYQGDSILWRQYLSSYWRDVQACLRAGGRVKYAPADEEPGNLAARIRSYIFAMDRVARTKVKEIIPMFVNLKLEGNILDVGAGSGAVSAGFLETLPKWQATLMDIPEVLEYSRELIQERGLGERVSYCQANILEAWPVKEQFDLIILSNVVHVYSEREVPCILEKAVECLKPEGFLLVHDIFFAHLCPKSCLL